MAKLSSKPAKEKTFKQVNIAVSDWDEYNKLAKQLTKELGFSIYVPGVIRKAVTFYKESLNA